MFFYTVTKLHPVVTPGSIPFHLAIYRGTVIGFVCLSAISFFTLLYVAIGVFHDGP